MCLRKRMISSNSMEHDLLILKQGEKDNGINRLGY
jgi:hypothetical protein